MAGPAAGDTAREPLIPALDLSLRMRLVVAKPQLLAVLRRKDSAVISIESWKCSQSNEGDRGLEHAKHKHLTGMRAKRKTSSEQVATKSPHVAMRKVIEFEHVEVLRVEREIVLCRINEKRVWLPRNLMLGQVWKTGDRGNLVLPSWLAREFQLV